jgi:hypothetical protein
MKIKEINTFSTLTIWLKSLQDNWHIYFPAHLRCSSLNRVTIPRPRKGEAGAVKPLKRLQLRSRLALLDRKINAPLALSNYGF